MPGPVFLAGDRVDLRTVDSEDAETLREWINHPDVRRYVQRYRLPWGEEEFEDGLFGDFTDDGSAALLVCDDDPVGMVGLGPVYDDRRMANLGCLIAPEHQGEGYGTAAGRLAVEYGFEELLLNRIEARCQAPNAGARRSLERIGFTEEGRKREAAVAEGEYVDEVVYGLLRREWKGEG
ncbi:GNAT family N-acetyltransferase [Halobacteriales archaeon QS_8_69_26]|nr:MAG: GNAT family N-acetyltransferase [Halobacteriales archaeon QS_8_69_26]